MNDRCKLVHQKAQVEDQCQLDPLGIRETGEQLAPWRRY